MPASNNPTPDDDIKPDQALNIRKLPHGSPYEILEDYNRSIGIPNPLPYQQYVLEPDYSPVQGVFAEPRQEPLLPTQQFRAIDKTLANIRDMTDLIVGDVDFCDACTAAAHLMNMEPELRRLVYESLGTIIFPEDITEE